MATSLDSVSSSYDAGITTDAILAVGAAVVSKEELYKIKSSLGRIAALKSQKTQCAAVTTKREAMSVPPQLLIAKVDADGFKSETVEGKSTSAASSPPMMAGAMLLLLLAAESCPAMPFICFY